MKKDYSLILDRSRYPGSPGTVVLSKTDQIVSGAHRRTLEIVRR